MSNNNGKNIYIIGAGVVGLSTALRAQEAGFSVTIIAEKLPGQRDIKYTSPWAGANHLSVVGEDETFQIELERETLKDFLELLQADPECPIMQMSQIEYRDQPREPNDLLTRLSTFYKDFRMLEVSELPTGIIYGASFSTISIDVARYLPYLLDRFLEAGGQAFRASLSSITSVISPSLTAEPVPISGPTTLPGNPVAIVNCTGLGARSLGDVLDNNVYPTRGQVILVRAPWVKSGMSLVPGRPVGGQTPYPVDLPVTYIIPRVGGTCIIGGVFEPHDWTAEPRLQTTKDIKERAIALCPELLPPDKRANPSIDDLDVIEVCTGLRPSRVGGIRLETTMLSFEEKSIPVIHNYGHGGAGYQCSWASARTAVDLLKAAVSVSKG